MLKVRNYGCVLLLLIFASAQGFSFPIFQLDTITLAHNKQKLQNGKASERTLTAYNTLLSKADSLLSFENPTVMDKTLMPPSGNKHDYLSISRYWWPNPEIPDGLPWIRKDGETNPETQTDAVDRKRLGALTSGIQNLCLAYFFSENERYAEKATSMIVTWFLDDETRMNPHLQFAQSVPGNPNGRSSGILDGRSIAQVIPGAIKMLSNSPHWTKGQNLKMTEWLNEYLTWLTESELGKTEFLQKNNHGSWCKYQVVSLALYLGNESLAKEVIGSTMQSFDQQFDVDGKQSHEIERTRSFFYSCFNLDALTSIAVLADKVGVDMWNYKSKNNKSLMLGVNYLAPVIKGKEWPYTDLHGTDLSNLVSTLVRMSNHTKLNELTSLLSKTMAILIEKEKETGYINEDLQELILMGELDL